MRVRSCLRSLALPFALAFTGALSSAQVCNSTNFWKNDELADVPSGFVTVAFPPGLCEGEAGAAVFDLGAMPNQTIEDVTVGFASAFGGLTAAVNIEIYDGVTFAGGIPTLGPKVFDLEQDVGNSLEVASTGLNTFNLGFLGIEVGNHPSKKFVVAYRISFNFNGNCTSGYQANLMTEGTGCSPQQKNLMFIQGQGWRDATLASVGPINICPLFWKGDWVIRACTSSAAVPICQPDIGNGGPGSSTLTACGDALGGGGSSTLLLENAPAFAPALLFYGTQNNPLPFLGGTIVPVPYIGFQTLLTDGAGSLSLPISVNLGIPANIYTQYMIFDTSQPLNWAFSNALRLEFL